MLSRFCSVRRPICVWTGVIYNVSFQSTHRAAAFLIQNLLIVACLPCSSSFEPNGHHSGPINKYSIAPPGDIRNFILYRLTAILIFSMPHSSNQYFFCLHSISSCLTMMFYLALRPQQSMARLFIRLPFFFRLLTMFGLYCPKRPFAATFYLALQPCLMAIFYLALQPCLTAIFYSELWLCLTTIF